MIYVSSTNRKLTEKYIDWAVAGLPTSKKLKPLEIITKKDCTKAVLLGVLRGTHLVYRWAEKNLSKKGIIITAKKLERAYHKAKSEGKLG